MVNPACAGLWATGLACGGDAMTTAAGMFYGGQLPLQPSPSILEKNAAPAWVRQKQAISARLVTRALGAATNKLVAGNITPKRFDKFVDRAKSWLPTHLPPPGAEYKLNSRTGARAVAPQLRDVSALTGDPKNLPKSIQEAYQSLAPSNAQLPKVQSLFGQVYDIFKFSPKNLREGVAGARALRPFGITSPAYSSATGQPLLSGSSSLRAPFPMFHELGHALDDAAGNISQSTETTIKNTMRNENVANRLGSQLYRRWLQILPETERAALPSVKQFLQSRRAPLDTYRSSQLESLLGHASDVRRGLPFNGLSYGGHGGHGRVVNKLLQQLRELASQPSPSILEKQAGAKWRTLDGLAAALKQLPAATNNGTNLIGRIAQLAAVKSHMTGGDVNPLSLNSVLPGLRDKLQSLDWKDINALNTRTLSNFNSGVAPRRLYRGYTTPAGAKNWLDGQDFGKSVSGAAHATLDPAIAGHTGARNLDSLSLIKTFKPQPEQKYFSDFGVETAQHTGLARGFTPADASKRPHGVSFNQIFETAVTPQHRQLMPSLVQPKHVALNPDMPNDTVMGGLIAHPPTSRSWRNIIREIGQVGRPIKQAELVPDVQLQEHQQRIADRISGDDPRLLVYHGLGSGKSLSALAAAEKARTEQGGEYGVVVPASLKGNFEKEISKFTRDSNPEVMSYTGLGMGKDFTNNPDTLIMDEAARLRNPTAASTSAAMRAAQKAKRLVLLTGTPITNEPSDIASLLSMLHNKPITPQQFDQEFVSEKKVRPGILAWLRGVKSGIKPVIKNENKLRALLEGKVDYLPSKTPEGVNVNEEVVRVPLSAEQQRIQKAIRTKIPPGFLWKLDQEFPMSRDELSKLNSFLTGLRQVSLSTQPFRADKDMYRAYSQSSKLQKAMADLQETLKSDPRKKAIIYSNFIDAGLNPYAAALEKNKIPHAFFHGGMPVKARQQALKQYNEGKLRALLLGPAAAEGISTKGTSLIQLLDPHWNEARSQQARGRGLRFDSHEGLPEELRNVAVRRYLSSSENPGIVGKYLLGRKRERTGDEVLERLTAEKEQFNDVFRNLLREVGSEKQSDDAAPVAKKKKPVPAPTAVIIRGNPKFITGNPAADKFYAELQKHMEQQGYSVTQDAGEPKTVPPAANVWLGHSRGVDRFRFAPEGTRTIGLGASGGINHPDDTAMAPGDVPTSAHYKLTPEMLKVLSAQLQQKQATDTAAKFTPDFTPEQLEELGVYNSLYRGGPRLASLGEWKPEWVNPVDPKGWAQWYKRYSGGRRLGDEDERQIKRWANFKSRHGGPFVKKPTPRRGWALQNWGIDPSLLVPEDQSDKIKTMLQNYAVKQTAKHVANTTPEQ